MLYSLVAFTRYDLLGLSGYGAGIGQNVEKLPHLSLVYAPDGKVMALDNLGRVTGPFSDLVKVAFLLNRHPSDARFSEPVLYVFRARLAINVLEAVGKFFGYVWSIPTRSHMVLVSTDAG